MKPEELEQALDPVRKYFRGSYVNENTVLAAHLRALGLPPNGEPWTAAKAAVKAGMTFAEAAAGVADGLLAEGVDLKPSRERHPIASAALSDAAVVASASASPARPVRGRRSVRSNSVAGSLEWFPKKFGPGDIDGDGARRLLGQPNIPQASVLVRETAQNSWDARLGDQTVEFVLNLRRLTSEQQSQLRTEVFTGASEGLGLETSLGADELWVLEISDRGTKGLGGPIRNDLTVEGTRTTNFIDLVLNIGAPRDVHLGGGTYGFGKTISYVVSRRGTILIWSRSEEVDGIEDRLIGSAIGPGFDMGGRRYTGRHWWGVIAEDDRVEPVVGARAAALGSELFSKGFSESETGTSILIVDPDLGGEHRVEDAERLATAVAWHLWPKLLVDQRGRVPMHIEVQLEGEPIALPAIETHSTLGGFAQALEAVRQVQAGTSKVDDFKMPLLVKEVRSHSPQKLLGHLALVRYPQRRRGEPTHSDLIPLPETAHHLAFMRHQAELVVKYDSRPTLTVDGVQWAGVFKPVAGVDDSFAAAEPPAHDDWVPASVSDRGQKRDVSTALRRFGELVSDFLRPASATPNPEGPSGSTAALADQLSALVGILEGPRPTRKQPPARTRTAQRGPTVEILDSRLGPILVGDRRHAAVRVRATASGGGRLRVTPRIAIGVEGGSDAADGLVQAVGWCSEEPDLTQPMVAADPTVELEASTAAWLVVNAPRDLALDLSFNAEVI